MAFKEVVKCLASHFELRVACLWPKDARVAP